MSGPAQTRVEAPTAAGASRVLAYGPTRIRVSGRSPDLEWLAEFLAPQFQAGPWDTIHADVGLRVDREDHRRLVDAGPIGGTLGCFALDRGIVRLPCWTSDPAVTVVRDPTLDVFYRISSAGAHVSIVSPAPTPGARIALLRVVRELATDAALERGGLFLHASAFAMEGGGVLVVGPKGAGKTTLLAQALAGGAARYVSNDRVLVEFGDHGVRLRGMPTVVTVHGRTLKMFPVSRHRLLRGGYRAVWTVREAEASGTRPHAGSDGKYGVSPVQFRRSFGTDASAEVPPLAVLFPEVAPAGRPDPGDGARPPESRRLPSDVVARRLLEAVLGHRYGARRPALLRCQVPGRDRGAGSARETCRRLAARIPGYAWPRVGEADRVARRLERFLDIGDPADARADGTTRGR